MEPTELLWQRPKGGRPIKVWGQEANNGKKELHFIPPGKKGLLGTYRPKEVEGWRGGGGGIKVSGAPKGSGD